MAIIRTIPVKVFLTSPGPLHRSQAWRSLDTLTPAKYQSNIINCINVTYACSHIRIVSPEQEAVLLCDWWCHSVSKQSILQMFTLSLRGLNINILRLETYSLNCTPLCSPINAMESDVTRKRHFKAPTEWNISYFSKNNEMYFCGLRNPLTNA